MLYVSILAAPLLLAGLAGHYIRTPGIKAGDRNRPNMQNTLAYIKANWQDGDIIYHTDDGSVINWLPYSQELDHYKMPDCAPVLGALSTDTRAAIGVPILPLDEIEHTRAWIAAPNSPLHPACYTAALDTMLKGDPLIQIDDNDFLESGVWLQ